MFIQELAEQFVQDLLKLKKEISLYNNDSTIWIVDKEINNTAGNLVLHLVGNLNHYIGATLCNTGYVRNRDLEFSDKNVSRTDLIKRIDDTILMIEKCIPQTMDETLDKIYPIKVFENEMTVRAMLISTFGHFHYHLGQINYHRRLLDS